MNQMFDFLNIHVPGDKDRIDEDGLKFGGAYYSTEDVRLRWFSEVRFSV